MIADSWSDLRRLTQARIALGRTGNALPTARVLEFELAHARARDAVHGALDTARLAADLAPLEAIVLSSCAADRAEYLQRPDLGRRLFEDTAAALPAGPFATALVISDGLSARAVHENAPALAEALVALLPEWNWAPVAIVRQGRVAIGDEVAAALSAEMVLVLIGERPGLSAADSLGAYLTFQPRPGLTRDSERNCVSNIRAEGLPPREAARRIAGLMQAARRLRLTGVRLKEDAALLEAGAPAAALPE